MLSPRTKQTATPSPTASAFDSLPKPRVVSERRSVVRQAPPIYSATVTTSRSSNPQPASPFRTSTIVAGPSAASPFSISGLASPSRQVFSRTASPRLAGQGATLPSPTRPGGSQSPRQRQVSDAFNL